jgi:hypothetical protein
MSEETNNNQTQNQAQAQATQEELKDLLKKAKEAWKFDFLDYGREVLEKLKEERIKNALGEDKYSDLKTAMKWLFFPSISENEQMDLISNNLVVLLYNQEFDLEGKFKTLRAATPEFVWADEKVPKLINAFLANKQKLGDVELMDPKENEKVPSTIGGWLKEYVRINGMDKKDEFAVTKYVSDSAAASSLNEEDKKALTRLLKLFEMIKVFTVEQILAEAEKYEENKEYFQKKELEEELIKLQQLKKQEKEAQAALEEAKKKYETQQQAFDNPLQDQASQEPEASDQQPEITPNNQEIERQAQVQAQAETQNQPQTELESEPEQQSGVRQELTSQVREEQQKDAKINLDLSDDLKLKSKKEGNLNKQNYNLTKETESQEIKPSGDKNLIRMTLKEAVERFPQIADQTITPYPLQRLNHETEVAPSIQNWIWDYRTRFGVKKHEEDEQMKFLKESPNAQKLNQDEKKRVAMLILSYDEEVPLKIDKVKGLVVF